MKINHTDFKKGIVKIQVESKEDLWYLSNIIDPGDRVKGQTIRKIKLGEADQRNMKIIKKAVFLTLEVERVENTGDILRISGIIRDGPEDVTRGTHHTFNIEENSIITIEKQEWLKYQKQRLKEASATEGPKILICVLDREEATIVLLKKYGFDVLVELKGDVEKKREGVKTTGNFYKDLGKQLTEYNTRFSPSAIIIGSPAFFKDDLVQTIEDDWKKKIILATCNATGKNGINEILKRPEGKEALRHDRIAKEMKVVEELLQEIAKDGLAAYGLKEVQQAAEAGAITKLLLTDKFIEKARAKEQYRTIDKIMKTAEKTDGEISIISGDHEGGQKLDGLGGIGAILRYKMQY